MTIHEAIEAVVASHPGRVWTDTEIKDAAVARFSKNRESVVSSDHAIGPDSKNDYCRCVKNGEPLLRHVPGGYVHNV